jgi:hypothetical protein
LSFGQWLAELTSALTVFFTGQAGGAAAQQNVENRPIHVDSL